MAGQQRVPGCLTLEEVLVHLSAVLLGDQHLAWWVGVLTRVGSRPTRLPLVSAAQQQQPVRNRGGGGAGQRLKHRSVSHLKTRVKQHEKRVTLECAGTLSASHHHRVEVLV